MTNSPVKIGGIALQNFEIPTSISFGGEQRLAIHRLSDGTRSIELLGPDDREIQFRGTFSGPTAEARVRALDSLRITGTTVPLTWRSFRYLVVVKTLLAEYKNPWWISYDVRCVVVNQTIAQAADVSLIAATIAADVLAAGAGLAATAGDLDGLSRAVNAAGALTAGTAANAQALNATGKVLNDIDSQIGVQTATLSVTDEGYANASAASSSFSRQLQSAGTLALTVNARSYVSRVGALLGSSG
jgi:hypothetical protein